MMKPFETMPAFDTFGRAGTETMLKSVATATHTAQTLGIEWTDFAKQSYQHGIAAMQKLAKAKSAQTAMEIQADFLKGSYERLVAQTGFTGELCARLTQEWVKPFGGMAPKLPARV